MIEPRDPDLDAFVALLRSATPPPEELAIARAGVLARATAPFASAASIVIKLGLVGLVIFAGGAPGAPGATASAKMAEVTAEAVAPVALVAPHVEPPPAILPRFEESAAPPVVLAPARPPRAARPAPLVLDVGDVPAASTGPSAPSATMAHALEHVEARRWSAAAGSLQEVVDGRTGDFPDRIEQAELLLAKSLFALGLHHAAAAAFEPVTRAGRAHPWFDASLPMLAELAATMPEPSDVVRSLEAWDDAELEPIEPARRDEVLFRIARQRVAEGQDASALQALARVPLDARSGLEARFLEGAVHARAGRSGPALRAFAQVAEGAGPAEPLFELAWLNLARLRYAIAAHLPENDARREALLHGALAAWRRIPERSPRWMEAFAEETWALYLAGDVDRALGHAHALTAPPLAQRADLEPQVVRAMIQLEHCQWDAVGHTVDDFGDRLAPRLRDAERAVQLAATREDAFRVLVAVRAGRSRVPSRILPAVRDALSDAELTRHLEQVRSIEREQRRLVSDPGLLEGDVATRVSSDLAVARSLAEDRAGEGVQRRLRRYRDGLHELASRMDTVELELTTERRRELDHPNRTAMERPEGGSIVGLAGGQLWPFTGEFWPDELPHYRQAIQNRCGR